MPGPSALPPPQQIRLHPRPSEQSHSRGDKNENDQLILRAVALEAKGHDIVVRGRVADGELLAQAELFGAVVADAGGVSTVALEGVIEGNDGGVGEAGAFAKGCWG